MSGQGWRRLAVRSVLQSPCGAVVRGLDGGDPADLIVTRQPEQMFVFDSADDARLVRDELGLSPDWGVVPLNIAVAFAAAADGEHQASGWGWR